MINIISALLYRLFRSSYFYICLALSLALPLLGAGLIGILINLLEDLSGTILAQYINPFIMVASQARLDSNTVILLAITVAMFISTEYKQGLIRNTVFANKSRMEIFFAYVITVALIVLIFATGTMLITSVSSALILGLNGESVVSYIGQSFAYYGVSIVALMFVGLFSLFMSMLFKKSGMSIAIPVIAFLLVFPIISTVVSYATAFMVDLQPLSWIPILNFTLIGNELDGILLAKCVIGMLIVLAGLGVGMAFYMKKCDIN